MYAIIVCVNIILDGRIHMNSVNIDQCLQTVENTTENMIFKILGNVFAPINIESMINKLDIDIIEQNLNIAAVGKIEINSSQAKIFLNTKETDIYKKRFTLAHELGHWHLYHIENKTVAVTEYSNNMQDEAKEVYANAFASSILVPKRIFKNVLQSTRDLSTLMQIFQVPKNVIKYRVINIYGVNALDTLGWE